MKATRKNVAAAILEKHGHHVELVKGEGYFYFVPAEGCDAKSEPMYWASYTSVYVYSITAFDVDGWVSEYEDMIEDVVIPEEDYQPKIIDLSKRVY